MSVSVDFRAGQDFTINSLSGSGLGFYGSNFGFSVPVGSYQNRTFITDSTGTAQGPETDNCKYVSSGVCILGSSGSGISLLSVPNYLSSLNIRLNSTTAVQVSNVKIYGYDRVSKLNDPSGVTIQAANIIHPNTVQAPTGSGSSTWTSIHGSSYLSLNSGPGESGLSPNGIATSGIYHDHYIALSLSPNTVGAKSAGLYYECEYL